MEGTTFLIFMNVSYEVLNAVRKKLHNRFYNNEKREKLGIKDSILCGMCRLEVDSVEHMLLYCIYSKELWNVINE